MFSSSSRWTFTCRGIPLRGRSGPLTASLQHREAQNTQLAGEFLTLQHNQVLRPW
ncbi:MAG: hypothetical protein ACPHJ3_00230 [Rubripirellula sp.]